MEIEILCKKTSQVEEDGKKNVQKQLVQTPQKQELGVKRPTLQEIFDTKE